MRLTSGLLRKPRTRIPSGTGHKANAAVNTAGPPSEDGGEHAFGELLHLARAGMLLTEGGLHTVLDILKVGAREKDKPAHAGTEIVQPASGGSVRRHLARASLSFFVRKYLMLML
jgi:hypothetical protein